MENLEIRRKLKEAGLYQWMLAESMGIAEQTLVRKLRRELPEAEKQKILAIVRNSYCNNSYFVLLHNKHKRCI